MSFAQILSEARKYRLNAILAHQTVSQIEDRSLVNVTLANAGTVICFRTANPLDEELMLPQFAPHIDQGEISNLPSYHFFMKVSAIEPQMPFSGETLPVKIPNDLERTNQIIDSSRELYATHIKSETSTKEQTTEAKPPSRAKRNLH